VTKYKVKDGDTIWTVANLLYGSVAYAFRVASDNGIEINDTILGLELEYEEGVKETVLQPLIVNEINENAPQIYIGLSNQTIFDIAMMTVGGLESVVSLLKTSTMLGINEDATAKQFSFTDTKNAVKKYIKFTGRVFGSKPIPADIAGREHDDSFNRLQYT
jgi:hypothetical protein